MLKSCQSSWRHLSPLAVLLFVLIGADAGYIRGDTETDDSGGIHAPFVFPTIERKNGELGYLTPLNSDHSELLRLAKIRENVSGILRASNKLNGTAETISNTIASKEANAADNFTKSEASPPDKKAKIVPKPEGASSIKMTDVVEAKEMETTKGSAPTTKVLDHKFTSEAIEGSTERQTQGLTKSDGGNSQGNHWAHDHLTGKGGPLPAMQSPEATILVAAIFVAVALFGYLGLVCWRRSLEKKYGTRELLVNEEEVNDMGDYKSYEIIGRPSLNGCT